MKEENASRQTPDPHPWYAGGRDALGPDGTCAECGKVEQTPTIGRLEAEIVLLRSQLLTALAEIERLQRVELAAGNLDRYSLVIESAVRCADPGNADGVTAAIVRLRGAMTPPAPVAVAPMKDDACE